MPALGHQLAQDVWAVVRSLHLVALLDVFHDLASKGRDVVTNDSDSLSYLVVGEALIGLLRQRGHLPQHHPEAPDVRLGGELPVLREGALENISLSQ